MLFLNQLHRFLLLISRQDMQQIETTRLVAHEQIYITLTRGNLFHLLTRKVKQDKTALRRQNAHMDIIGYLRRIDLYDNRFHILISSRIIGITTIGVIRIFASGGVRIVRITASSFKMRFQFGIPGNLIT